MCGIAGAVHRDTAPAREIIDRQLALLRDRGPDSLGAFAVRNGVVGQTRLAIIDIPTGDPPLTDESGLVGAVLNGEIYNFRELRTELLQGGHRFRSNGDTEVLAHLAEDLDLVELASRLHGMFAFAVWDSRVGELLLGRDRLGKKPLYYWHSPRTFVFASEIKAVLAHPHVCADLDESALPAYLRFGYVPTPRTFFSGVVSVPPGHVVRVRPDLTVDVREYWRPAAPRAAEHDDMSFADGAVAVRSALRTAVERRLASDVPLGAFLSGGIDSSAVVATMSELADRPVRTFTIGFEDDEGYDERPFAKTVASRFGTDHTELVVRPQAADLVDVLVDLHDQPFGDSSAVPSYLLAQLTRGHVTVALSGDGGDELFAGYERFTAGLMAARAARLPSPLTMAAARLARHSPAPARLRTKVQRFASRVALGMPDAYRLWISYIDDDLVASLVRSDDTWAIDDYRTIWSSSQGAATLDRLQLLNLRTYLLDDLLPKVDRTSMAHGLEVRSPFLDHELVDLALRLPPRLRMRGLSLKRVLRAAMADVLPAEILERGKHGFGVPLRRWFREDLSAYVDARLGSQGARVRQHLDASTLDRILREHRSGVRDHGHAIWTLLTLEAFLRRRGW